MQGDGHTDAEQHLHDILIWWQETDIIKYVLNPIRFIQGDRSMQELYAYANVNAFVGSLLNQTQFHSTKTNSLGSP